MVVDCFLFYNELDMLEFRLTELNDYVDYFVIVEGTLSFSGKDKPLYFNENKERFQKFLHKIVHIVLTDIPRDYATSWNREWFSRDAIQRGLDKLTPKADDLIIVSDCDEIPDLEKMLKEPIENLKNGCSIASDIYYYNLYTRLHYNSNWFNSPVIISYGNIMNYGSISQLREKMAGRNQIPKCGWHFGYFGNESFISNKIKNFAHTELNNEYFTDEHRIKNLIVSGKDLFDRQHEQSIMKVGELSSYLPKNYQMLLNFTK